MKEDFFKYDDFFKNGLPICKCNTCDNNLGGRKRKDDSLCGFHCIGDCREEYRGIKIIKDGIMYITVNTYNKYNNYKPNPILLALIENGKFLKKEDFEIE